MVGSLLDADDRYPLEARAAWLLRQLRQVSRIAREQHNWPRLAKRHRGQ